MVFGKDIISFLTPFAGKLGDEDCCFRKQTDNHDKSCLHIDKVVLQIEEICKTKLPNRPHGTESSTANGINTLS